MTFLQGGFGGGGTSNPFGSAGSSSGSINPFGTSGTGLFGNNPGPPGGIGFGTGGFGSSQSKSGGPGPGFVSPFDQQAVAGALNLGSEAMANRYAQLGLSGTGATPTSPGGPAGGIGVGAIGTGALPADLTATPGAGGTTGNPLEGNGAFPVGPFPSGFTGSPTNFPGASGSMPTSFGPGTPFNATSGGGETTAEAMDLGQIPTLTGGLPGEAAATIGEIQNANLQTQSGNRGSGGGKGGGGKGGLGAIGSLAMMGGK